MKTSARNQLEGQVTAITRGAVNDEIEVGLSGGERITTIITHTSAERLGLIIGSAVTLLIKAPWIILATDLRDMCLSARNQLEGLVESMQHGAVNTEVKMTLPGGSTLVAVVTNEGADELQLAPGNPVTALIKASHIILGVRR